MEKFVKTGLMKKITQKGFLPDVFSLNTQTTITGWGKRRIKLVHQIPKKMYMPIHGKLWGTIDITRYSDQLMLTKRWSRWHSQALMKPDHERQ